MACRSGWLLAFAVVACGVAPAPLHASGCQREIVIPIRFPAGAACWRHVGAGTTFVGQFGARQHVTATAAGQMYESDGKRTWVTTGPWQLSVAGPGGFSAGDDGNGRLDTTLPQGGRYTFSIGPCAVWGNEGTIEICAQ